MYKSFVSLGRYIPKYFILFVAMVNPPFILSRFCVRPPPPKSHWSSGETSTRTTHHKIRQLVLTKNEVQDVSVGVVREGFTEETALSGHLSRNQRS